MIYVLDTNIITALMKGEYSVLERIQGVLFEGHDVTISCITYYEIKRGLLAIKASTQIKKFELLLNQLEIILFDNIMVFDEASRIFADLKIRGELISDADILIASGAKVNGFILVSRDDDFKRVKGLKLENWRTNY